MSQKQRLLKWVGRSASARALSSNSKTYDANDVMIMKQKHDIATMLTSMNMLMQLTERRRDWPTNMRDRNIGHGTGPPSDPSEVTV